MLPPAIIRADPVPHKLLPAGKISPLPLGRPCLCLGGTSLQAVEQQKRLNCNITWRPTSLPKASLAHTLYPKVDVSKLPILISFDLFCFSVPNTMMINSDYILKNTFMKRQLNLTRQQPFPLPLVVSQIQANYSPLSKTSEGVGKSHEVCSVTSLCHSTFSYQPMPHYSVTSLCHIAGLGQHQRIQSLDHRLETR